MEIDKSSFNQNHQDASKLSKEYIRKIRYNTFQPDVPCLESIKNLLKKCEAQNLKFSNIGDYAAACEVDMIFAHNIIQDQTYYYVKWKNRLTDCNTWEPESRLKGCREIIEYYHALRSSNVELNSKLLHYFVQDLTSRKPCDILSLKKTYALVAFCDNSSENDIITVRVKVSQLKQKIREILFFSDSKIKKLTDKLLDKMKFAEARKRVLINLKEWEMEINQQKNIAYISVENNVDLATAPAKFQFINDYINTAIEIPEEPVAFCSCENCFVNKDSCCPRDSEGHFAYDENKRLILSPGFPIYECNKFCQCDQNCKNRVIQHGTKVRVCIFRTSNNCGWGLKTLDPIEAGQFVLEYLGEIITSDLAEARSQVYNYVSSSYLFDLDYGTEQRYTVDAKYVGNTAHFINHSCDPNLHAFGAWINQPDPNLPRVAFFAKRNINCGEELTFDYKMGKRKPKVPESSLYMNGRVLCQCNSKNCKKYLF